MKTFTVYIIKSLKHDLHYIGHTANLEDRLTRHNENRSTYTKGKGPWITAATYECNTKSKAYKLEMKLKGFKNSVKAIEYLKKLSR